MQYIYRSWCYYAVLELVPKAETRMCSDWGYWDVLEFVPKAKTRMCSVCAAAGVIMRFCNSSQRQRRVCAHIRVFALENLPQICVVSNNAADTRF